MTDTPPPADTSTSLPTRPCEACGAPLLFVRNPENGKWIPLDATPARRPYLFTIDDDGKPLLQGRAAGAMVSHYSTCPKANEFGRGRRGAKR